MAATIAEQRQTRSDLLKQSRAMLDLIQKENRRFNPAEEAKYQTLDMNIDRLTMSISGDESALERRRKLAEEEIKMNGKHGSDADVDGEKEFRNMGELLFSLARAKKDLVTDDRLTLLRERREQTMGVGSTGGYAVPEQFSSTIRQVAAAEAIVRPRATVIAAGNPPDAVFSFPALDQTAKENMFGGITLYHTGESVTMTESDIALRLVTLEPKEISGYVVVSNKLLANWEAAGSFITSTLASAMVGQEDFDFLRGDGVNKATGVLNHASTIAHSRAGAGAISFPDVCNMLSRSLMRGGSYVWAASQTTIPQLAAMADVGGHAVWLGAKADNLTGGQGPLPSTLIGVPIVFSDRLPALGSRGDLSLLNLGYYLIKDGTPMAIASSEHILFLSNRTVFKIVWHVDGHPWLTEPLQLEGSPTNTCSPFVVLA